MNYASVKKRVREVVNVGEDPLSRVFDALIIMLILASVFAVMLESMPEIESEYGSDLYTMEMWITFIFTAEYALRIWSAEKRLKKATQWMTIVDLIAIVPFYLTSVFPGVNLVFLRTIRLVRIFRVLKLFRYMQFVSGMEYVISNKKAELITAVFVAMLVAFIVGGMAYVAEHDTFGTMPNAVWWAIVTVSTVGYGDVVPHTLLGKLFASILMLCGIGLIAVPAAIISSGLTEYQMVKKKGSIPCARCGKLEAEKANYCSRCGKKLKRKREE